MSSQENLEAKLAEISLTVDQQRVEIARLEAEAALSGDTGQGLREQLRKALADKQGEQELRRAAESKIVDLTVANARLEIETAGAQADSHRCLELMAAQHGDAVRLMAYRSTMRGLVEDMDAMLRRLEWGGVDKDQTTSYCVICHTNGQHPHRSDCRLIALRLRVKQALNPAPGTLPHDVIPSGDP